MSSHERPWPLRQRYSLWDSHRQPFLVYDGQTRQRMVCRSLPYLQHPMQLRRSNQTCLDKHAICLSHLRSRHPLVNLPQPRMQKTRVRSATFPRYVLRPLASALTTSGSKAQAVALASPSSLPPSHNHVTKRFPAGSETRSLESHRRYL